MTVARFRIDAPMHAVGAPDGLTVLVDRAAGLFCVRLRRRRRLYTLPLSTVAGMVVHRIVLAETAEKKRARRAPRWAKRRKTRSA